MYGPQTAFYSLDKQDTRNYVMYFYPDLKMQVPGGYGNYRTGSLGKLAKLDNKPELLAKTFSIATTSFVTIYYYPNTEDVYYGTDIQSKPQIPAMKDLLLMPGNAGIFDRIYLALTFIDKDELVCDAGDAADAAQDDDTDEERERDADPQPPAG